MRDRAMKIQSAFRQKGAILIVGLLLLLILTILGVSTMNNALLEHKIVSNIEDGQVALSAAEAALREGEKLLQQQVLPEFKNHEGLYITPNPPPNPPLWNSIDWRNESAVRRYTGFIDAPGSLARVRADYIIEKLPPAAAVGQSLAADSAVDGAGFYRITARGARDEDAAAVVLQSIFRR